MTFFFLSLIFFLSSHMHDSTAIVLTRRYVIGLICHTALDIALCVVAVLFIFENPIFYAIVAGVAVCLLIGIIGAYLHNTILLWFLFLTYCLAFLGTLGAATAICVIQIFFTKPADDRDVTPYTSPVLACIYVVLVFGFLGGIGLFFLLGAWLTRRFIRRIA